MDLEIAGRGYLITGGTDGLGLALAATLTNEGARVAVCGRDEQRLANAREQVPGLLAVKADVTKPDELAAFVERAHNELGRLDGVVSNAGQSAAGLVANSSDDEWRRDFELKVLPAVSLARQCADELERNGGSILSVLTIKAKAPDAGSTPTAASRAAGLALTKALAGELGPRGIRSNAILIGLVESGQWVRRAESMNMELSAFYDAVLATQKIPLGRFGRAEEFAALAAFVLSPKASYLTGVGINLDGGLSPVI